MIELLEQFSDNPSLKLMDEIFYNLNDEIPNWYKLKLFLLIYLKPEYKDYAFGLLENKIVSILDLKPEEIKNLLYNTEWGYSYIFDNLDTILYFYNSFFLDSFISLITSYLKDKPKSYWTLVLNKINATGNQEYRDSYIYYSTIKCLFLDEADIIQNFYSIEGKKVLSSLPSKLIFRAMDDEWLNSIIKNNADLFFESEANDKCKFYFNYIDYISDDIKTKFSKFLEFYKKLPYQFGKTKIGEIVTKLYNYDDQINLAKIVGNSDISYLNSGTLSTVYRIDDKVLKLSTEKYSKTTEGNFFMIAPTKINKIIDEDDNTILIVEEQPFLSDTYNGKRIERDDVVLYMQKIEELGYEVTDPHCKNYETDNFGFLKDYHEATLGEYKSLEDLPDWFKEKPIVLLDVDLIYKKENVKKRRF